MASAAVTGAAVLAACSGGSTDSGDGSGADVISPPASTPTSASAPSTAATSTAASSGPAAAGSSAPAGTELIALDTLAVGASKAVKLADGKPAIVTRTGTTTAVCFSAICTHMGCTVKPKGGQFDCPCHGSSFDARTGAVLGGPAPSPLPKIDVAVGGGAVVEPD